MKITELGALKMLKSERVYRELVSTYCTILAIKEKAGVITPKQFDKYCTKLDEWIENNETR